jgi:hypothetical protein
MAPVYAATDIRRRIRPSYRPRIGRLPVSIPAQADGGAAVARDLTMHGARVVATRNFAVGERFPLRLELPGFVPIDAVAEVRWVDFHSGGRLYAMGCRFAHTDVSRRAMELLATEVAQGSIPEVLRSGRAVVRPAGPPLPTR